MATALETGYLIIADLTGYTAYLSSSEIEHAPLIAGDLLETVVGRLVPPLRLAKFEGDAAFLYMEDGHADGSLLLDAMEAAYIAFRRRLRSIDAASGCACDSCRLAPSLDLKLFVHHGAWIRGAIAQRDELAGRDVILVHRLLKGTVASEARASGFAQITTAAVETLGFDPAALGLVPAEETFEHLGTVRSHVLDLEARWQDESARRTLDHVEGSVIVDLELIVAAEPSVVWAHLTMPALRSRWEGPLVIEEAEPGARRGVGAKAQCVTGRLATLEEVVDWQPWDHVGWRLAHGVLGPVVAAADLAAVDGGTRVRSRWTAQGEQEPDPAVVARIREERAAALARLGGVIAGGSPVHYVEVPS
jgi:hypothetical protein